MDISAFGNIDFDKEANKVTLYLIHGKCRDAFSIDIMVANSEGEVVTKEKAVSTSPEGAEYISLLYLERLGFYSKRFEEVNRNFTKSEYGNDVEAEFYDNSLPRGAVLLRDNVVTPFEAEAVNG